MGWTPTEEIIKIDFTGTRFEGLTVMVHDIETNDILEMVRLSAALKNESGGADALEKLVTMAAAMIEEWDLEKPRGNPLPPTRETLGKLGQKTVLPLVTMIIKAVQDVGEDLGKGSPSGPRSLAVLPMTAP